MDIKQTCKDLWDRVPIILADIEGEIDEAADDMREIRPLHPLSAFMEWIADVLEDFGDRIP